METTELFFQMTKVDLLWHELYTSDYPDINNPEGIFIGETEEDPENPEYILNCQSAFDFSADLLAEFYIDTFIKLPDYVSFQFRATFQTEDGSAFRPDSIFVAENLEELLRNALLNALDNFRSLCEQLNVILPKEMLEHEPELPEEQLQFITSDMITDYQQRIKPFIVDNSATLSQHALTVSPVQNWAITFLLPFLVMDEILFNDPRFNRRKNRDEFFQKVESAVYFSLRNKCITIKESELTLNQWEMHYFLIIQDCALQMAMGDKGEFLNETMLKTGFTQAAQNMWYTGAGKIVEMCRGSVQVCIESNEKFDWYKLMQ